MLWRRFSLFYFLSGSPFCGNIHVFTASYILYHIKICFATTIAGICTIFKNKAIKVTWLLFFKCWGCWINAIYNPQCCLTEWFNSVIMFLWFHNSVRGHFYGQIRKRLGRSSRRRIQKRLLSSSSRFSQKRICDKHDISRYVRYFQRIEIYGV